MRMTAPIVPKKVGKGMKERESRTHAVVAATQIVPHLVCQKNQDERARKRNPQENMR